MIASTTSRDDFRRIRFLNSIRIAILSGLLFTSLLVLLLLPTPSPVVPLIAVLGLAIVISLLFIPLSRTLSRRRTIYLQIGADLAIVSFLVYLSGGIGSPFYFLYLLPILVSAIFLSRYDTIITATIAFVVFGTLADLLFLKIIPCYPGIEPPDITMGAFVYNLIMAFISFAGMSVLFSYYFEKIRRTRAELASVREDLLDLVQLNGSVLEEMENGFLTCDSRGKVVSCNKKAAAILGVAVGSDLFPLILSPEGIRQVQSLSSSHKRHYFERGYGAFQLGISVSVLERFSSYHRLFVFLITDLTEMKSISRRLEESEHLALIGQMVASIAHEIRNPLASISGSVQFLKGDLTLEPSQQRLMEIIVHESERLSKSIEDFLSFTRITPVEAVPFDLSAIVDEVVEMLAISQRHIRFERRYDRPVPARGDTLKLKQLLWNLLNNAVKASPTGGAIVVSILREEAGPVLKISDAGVGMKREDLDQVFTPFFSRFSSGIGLGMALVKRIVDEHRFRIAIESERNRGTEVTVWLQPQSAS